METLRQKQTRFMKMFSEFVIWVHTATPYQLTFGEAYRPPELAKLYAAQGRGIANSLHTQRLAVDINLFDHDGSFIAASAHPAYLRLGVEWERRGGSWGGRFSRPDANHFSLEHEGVR